MLQEREVLLTTRQEDNAMIELYKKENRYFHVDKFDEEDWNELMLTDLWEPFEDGKAFLRVN